VVVWFAAQAWTAAVTLLRYLLNRRSPGGCSINLIC
jgi:hypothetical protein